MKIIIEAIDNDQNRPQKSTTILLLHVRDVNDHEPVIEIQYIVEHKNDTAFISENSPNPSILAHISTSDLDDGENGRVTSTVETFIPGTENTMTESETFVIRDELLRTTIKLDREVRGEYDVIIKACDYGVPPKCARSQQVKIIVLDENEFAPFFLHAKIDIVFPEDTEVGSVIANAMATDRDAENGPAWVLSEYGELEASPNGLVTFEIQLAESDDAIASLPVRIDPTSANLTLARTLDYETRRLWKFVIIGRDGGRPVARESQCAFTLRVRNVNDNPPIFVNPNANNSVIFVPIRASSYVFATIKAVDLGVDERTEMRYSYTLVQKDGKIIDRNRYKDLFKLDQFSGKFSLHWFKLSIPDILGSYTAIIEVTDFGTPPLTTSIAVIMKVVSKDTQTDPVVPNSNKVRQVEISSTSSMVLLAAVFGGCGSGFLVIGIAVVICIRRKRNKTANEKGSDAAAPDSPRVSQDCGVENSTTAGVQTFDTKTSDESVAPELPRRSRTHSKTVPKIAVSPTPQVNDGSSSEHIYVMMKPIPPPPLAKQNFKRGQRKTKESAAIKNPVQNLAPRRTPLPITSNASAGATMKLYDLFSFAMLRIDDIEYMI
ncbi:unnamed protein product [Clavelina lepadiformis]|uniref:Cadherin domain-containing protein n=1 Tax=Clavelina lepadiformis TaxID=159417 RepID=A0ABP0FZ85_CLALP